MKKVLVYGFYKKELGHNGNLGDQLFIEAFQEIFPEIEFKFVDGITITNMQGIDAIFFGGGSFLNIRPNFAESILEDIKRKNIFYLGVGGETDIHPWHKELLGKAKLIACRSGYSQSLEKINKNIIYCCDLVYGLTNKIKLSIERKKSVLILPCFYLVPKYNDPLWKGVSWEYYKNEFSQFILWMINQGYKVNFFPMGQSEQVNDEWAAIEILNKMVPTKNYIINDKSINNFGKLVELFSSNQLVIAQRFHGSILSHMSKTNCINIHHHDKMKTLDISNVKNISYYGISKDSLINAFNSMMVRGVEDRENMEILVSEELSINMDNIKRMRERVINLL